MAEGHTLVGKTKQGSANQADPGARTWRRGPPPRTGGASGSALKRRGAATTEKDTGLSTQLLWSELTENLLEKQRRKLDPDNLPEIVARIRQLASRATGLRPDEAMAPGLECIVRIAYDIGRIVARDLPTRRGETRTRHAAALDAMVPVAVPFWVHKVLEEAASLGELWEDEDGNTHMRAATPTDDEEAIGWVRVTLGARLRLQSASDQEILRAVQAYRPGVTERGKGLGRDGRPRKGLPYASLGARAEALNGFLATLGMESASGAALARFLRRQEKVAAERSSSLLTELRGEAVATSKGRKIRAGR